MRATFTASSLIELFRAGLVALIPVAERARIAWCGPMVYDPWDRIEEALFASIVASVVEETVPSSPASLPRYGFTYPSYSDHSFFTERTARLRGERLVFWRLTTVGEPFDTMRFFDVDASFVPTGRTMDIPLAQALPELAARTADGLYYRDVIEYEE